MRIGKRFDESEKRVVQDVVENENLRSIEGHGSFCDMMGVLRGWSVMDFENDATCVERKGRSLGR